ncbi:MAG: hypothetical protein H6621_05170 [Halobacteriovoraceae bacterium]|nr:hypothetical protein [Halobacteriovoraceae bacterium]
MKTLLRYWRNPFNKARFSCLLFVIALVTSVSTFAQRYSTLPGILQSLQSLVDIDNRTYKKLIQEYQNAPFLSEKQLSENPKKYHISNEFLRHIIFNTNSSLIALASKNSCQFAYMLWLDLLRVTNGRIKNIILEDDAESSYLIDPKKYSEIYLKNHCPELFTTIKYFEKSEFDNLVSNLRINVPKNNNECYKFHESILDSNQLPFYIFLGEKINEGEKILLNKKGNTNLNAQEKKSVYFSKNIKNNLGSSKTSVIKSLISNLDNEQQFCSRLFNDDFFSVVLQNRNLSYLLQPMCRGILKKYSALEIKDYDSCISSINNHPEACSTAYSQFHRAYFPKNNCPAFNTNYNNSIFNESVSDCPGSLSNESIINIGRIIQYFSEAPPLKQTFSPPKCASHYLYEFRNFSKEMGIEDTWKNQLCYFNEFAKETRCFPVIFGGLDKHPESVTNVVSKILYESKKLPLNNKCKFNEISNLSSLEMSRNSGCNIYYSSHNCSVDQCPIKIFLNGRKLSNFITYKNDSSLFYFPDNYKNLKSSAHHLLKNKFKLKESKIFNLTQLKEKLKKKSIIHGLGCGEDLYPNDFFREQFNQCHPIPFIVVGVSKDLKYLTERILLLSAIDNISSPQIVEWKTIQSSIENFQATHPTNHWSLHALYR